MPTFDRLIIGCGYLGLRVGLRWLQSGLRVAAVTRTLERAAILQQQGFEPLLADVAEAASLDRLPAAEGVLWAVGYDRQSGHSQQAVYVEGLRAALLKLQGRAARLIAISSTSVYGQDDGDWVTAESPTHPATESGRICLQAEAVVREFFPAATILRLAGIYGPGRLLSKAETLRNREPLSGRGDAWLNLTHVDDAATAVITCDALRNPLPLGLVCDDEPVLRGDYYAALAERIGAPPPVFSPDLPAKRGSGGINKRCQSAPLKSVLGIEWTFPTFREGLNHALGDSVTLNFFLD